MNSFDAVVYLGLAIAVVTGFNAGLLRSAVTILAYLVAMPIAVWAMSMVSPAPRAGSVRHGRRIRCCSSGYSWSPASCWES
jgi:NhaP-type Na+/H+ or K+/H+ antiporter